MSKEKDKLPEWPSPEEGGGIHTEGGPDGLDAGAWGTYEPYLADLELYLGDLEYPVSKEELVQHVRSQQAPEVIVLSLEQLPETEYTSAADISLGLDEIE